MFTTTTRPLLTPPALKMAAAAASRSATTVTPAQINIVKATAPVLKEHGTTITTTFYNNMLAAHPELKNIFSLTSQATGAQPRALAASVLAYAQHIDNLPALTHAVERIAHKHASLFVTPQQYDIVGTHLLGAIGQVLGPAATPEIVDAWTAAYAALAQVFIQREAQLYEDNGAAWQGWRKFRIAKKVPESENIVSLYLEPVDGATLPTYLPGQYVSLQVKPESLGYFQSRQYSMSTAPPTGKEGGENYYRVSVKREEGDEAGHPQGVVSNMLHDEIPVGGEVDLSHPQGEFFVNPNDEGKANFPLVLMSAGIGATPLMGILDAVSQSEVKRPTSWIQAAVSEKRIPFSDEVGRIVTDKNIKASVFLGDGEDGGTYKGWANGFGGRVDLGKLDGNQDLFLDDKTAEYYLCGPEEWMIAMRKGLEELGVERSRVNLELFNTGDVPADA